MLAVERGELADAQTLRGRHDGRIDRSQGKISVFRDQLGNSNPITRLDGVADQVARRQVPDEPNLGIHP